LIEPFVRRFPGGERIPPLRKLASYIRQANIPLPERLQTYNPLHMNPLREVLTDDFLENVDTAAPLRMLDETYRRAPTGASLNRMLYLDWKIALADNDLRKVNRMCEASGIEVRYPMLDPALVEFSTRIPVNLKLSGLRLRYYYKRALRDFLPREIINKPKHGFGLPFGVWLKEHAPLQTLARDHIEAFRRRGYVRPEYIDGLLHRHRTDHAAFYGTSIWNLLMLEMWLRAHDVS
jgi:asparagine synthase (glutamine-hydrolysing)